MPGFPAIKEHNKGSELASQEERSFFAQNATGTMHFPFQIPDGRRARQIGNLH